MIFKKQRTPLMKKIQGLQAPHGATSTKVGQQNGAVEWKNEYLQKMHKTMINDNSTPKQFWAEALDTTCYLQNRIYIRPIIKNTTYELWKGRKPNISYLHPFGCKCFILNTKDK